MIPALATIITIKMIQFALQPEGWEVVADDEDHRQREVVVVQRALASLLAQRCIQRLTGLRSAHQRLLAGDDGEEDVTHYDRPDDRTNMDEGCASAKQV
ncbi:MAG: hypothetical protein R2815_08825 [Flavobacteriales bacterium]